MKEVYLNQTQILDKWNKQANKFTKPQYINKKEKKKIKDKDLRRPTFWVWLWLGERERENEQ